MIEQLNYDRLAHSLDIEPGTCAIIGSGGKSTLLGVLGAQLARDGARVLLATSTHMHPVPGIELYLGSDADALAARIARRGVVCCGTPVEEGKLSAPALPFTRLARLADYVLIEADGSRGLPLKAHAPHEPVVPAGTRRALLVVGAHAFGSPVQRVAHRPELFCERAGCCTCATATPALAARVIEREEAEGALHLPEGCTLAVVATHVDGARARRAAEELAACCDVPVFALDHPARYLARIS